MLRSSQRLFKHVQTASAAQLQQLRFLNVHEYQVGVHKVSHLNLLIPAGGDQPGSMQGCADTVHCLYCTQGAELMSKFGINVPPGKSAHSLDDVKTAAEAMKDENNEVCSCQYDLDRAKVALQTLLVGPSPCPGLFACTTRLHSRCIYL